MNVCTIVEFYVTYCDVFYSLVYRQNVLSCNSPASEKVGVLRAVYLSSSMTDSLAFLRSFVRLLVVRVTFSLKDVKDTQGGATSESIWMNPRLSGTWLFSVKPGGTGQGNWRKTRRRVGEISEMMSVSSCTVSGFSVVLSSTALSPVRKKGESEEC